MQFTVDNMLNEKTFTDKLFQIVYWFFFNHTINTSYGTIKILLTKTIYVNKLTKRSSQNGLEIEISLLASY